MAIRRWGFRPRPEPHELFTSWLHRLALANATSDHTLGATMLPGVAIWNRDPDRSFDPAYLPVVSMWTGVPVRGLECMLLSRWVGRLSESVSSTGYSAWILPIGVYHRLRRRGLLFCPACLQEGKADAFWMWRMAWSVCCRRHRKMLLDSCSSCGEVYMPHRTAPSLLGRMPCVCCGSDLARAPQCAAPVWAWQMQQRLETAMLEGRTQIHGHAFFALPLFQGLRSLVSLLLSPRGLEMAAKLVDVGSVSRARPAPFELRSAPQRYMAMEACWVLMADWPHRFLAVSERVGLRRSHLMKMTLEPAYWTDSAFNQLPGVAHRELNTAEVRAIATWLDSVGGAVSWASVLQASGVGVPTRVPQPALETLLHERGACSSG